MLPGQVQDFSFSAQINHYISKLINITELIDALVYSWASEWVDMHKSQDSTDVTKSIKTQELVTICFSNKKISILILSFTTNYINRM